MAEGFQTSADTKTLKKVLELAGASKETDMWRRMLKAGSNMHVLADQVTAFRIRSGNANMSAPRWDSRLRTQFEGAQILKHYATMAPEFLRQMFAPDLAQRGIAPERPPETWLVDLALGTGMASHCWFALQLLYDSAKDLDGYNRLRGLTGRVDIFGLQANHLREVEINRLQHELEMAKQGVDDTGR